MADLEAVLADVSYLMAMEKSKCTPAARASKKLILPDKRFVFRFVSSPSISIYPLIKFNLNLHPHPNQRKTENICYFEKLCAFCWDFHSMEVPFLVVFLFILFFHLS